MFLMVSTFLVTLFFSFGVQSLFYLWYKFTNDKILKFQHVFQYYSGIIGDGVLVPVINIFAVQTLLNLQVRFSGGEATWGFIGGFLITFIIHFGQGYYNQINWTMPTRWRWTILGLYHALFMFFESSFLCYTLLVFLKNISSFEELVYSPVGAGLGVLFLFTLTFIYDYWKPLFRNLFK